MVDVIPVDKDKWMLKVVMGWLKRKYKTDGHKTNIHEDMQSCGNPAIAMIYKKLMECAKLEAKHQQNAMIDYPELGLWVCYRDTAYRDPFFYTIKHILDMKDELMPLVEKYYKEPKDWYCNRWVVTKNNTQKGKDAGKIPNFEGEMSYDETFFTPQTQQKRIREITKELDNEYEDGKKKRRW